MHKEKDIRKKILKKIENLSEERLNIVWELLKDLEDSNKNKAVTLSLAGAWKDFDEDFFEDLTTGLQARRSSNKRDIA